MRPWRDVPGTVPGSRHPAPAPGSSPTGTWLGRRSVRAKRGRKGPGAQPLPTSSPTLPASVNHGTTTASNAGPPGTSRGTTCRGIGTLRRGDPPRRLWPSVGAPWHPLHTHPRAAPSSVSASGRPFRCHSGRPQRCLGRTVPRCDAVTAQTRRTGPASSPLRARGHPRWRAYARRRFPGPQARRVHPCHRRDPRRDAVRLHRQPAPTTTTAGAHHDVVEP